jgi:hypothetical protein
MVYNITNNYRNLSHSFVNLVHIWSTIQRHTAIRDTRRVTLDTNGLQCCQA